MSDSPSPDGSEGQLLPIPDPAESARLLASSPQAAATEGFRSGFVALIGRPNVGKSTLLNQLVGEKVAITSPVAQTTRNRLRAILTTPPSWCCWTPPASTSPTTCSVSAW